ncbi:hypothetical protein RGV33_02260 [Pseudomonas sp. Bout1]|uniref:hypothetical protein n=1 Tax=Pseudomonas sp. Bout1 TaxID=3048600 RepID=UPI002AB5BE54|nr:hypothetical protein [Pseudomonas sp. Bout1]MDY7530510.1 hypothetical protein [Pseudomonas sp. Bout1]MEB0185861.1 hypothetical protein [Pseudomonas sp. Bout1]
MQPFLSMIFLTLIGKNYRHSRIGCVLVRLVLTLAALAPKRSKNTVFSEKHIKVQLNLKKLVAPYLLC